MGTEGVALSAMVGVNVTVGGIAGVMVGNGLGIPATVGGTCPLASTVNATEVATAFPSGVGVVWFILHAKVTSSRAKIMNKIFFFMGILLLTFYGIDGRTVEV